MTYIQRALRDVPSDVLYDHTGQPLETWCLERGFRPMWIDVINERARRKPRRAA